jgi:hypothetical protein
LFVSVVRERATQNDKRNPAMSQADLRTIADSATTSSLLDHYVRLIETRGGAMANWRRRVDHRRLSRYARYLEDNRLAAREIDEKPLPERDLIPHRMWPVAGFRAPLMVDLLLCLVMSFPGFFWAYGFLWQRGWLVRVALLAFTAVWMGLLLRTSRKAWVAPATANFYKLARLRYLIPQLFAASLIGATAWVAFNPLTGLLCFLCSWFAIGLTVGFGQTLAVDTLPKAVGPFGALKRDHIVSLLSALAAVPVLALGFYQSWGWTGVVLAVLYGALVGQTVASALWRRYLAMIIASAARLPAFPGRFLKRMRREGLMRVAATAYQFRHDDVRTFFAQR